MFPQQDMYGREIIVEELVLFQTGTYNDQFRRDYRVNGGNQNGYMNAMDKLNEVTRDGTNLNATAIAQAGLTIIAPATEATPQSFVQLPNGWGQERFIFMMKVRVTQAMSNIINYYYLTGYTDTNEVSLSGHIASNLAFYINNSCLVREISNVIHGALVPQLTGVQISQVLTGQHHTGMSALGPTGNNDYQMLPSTIAEMAGSLATTQFVPAGMPGQLGQPNQPMLDTTPMFFKGSMLQFRDNNMPNRWLSRYLQGYSVGMADSYNDETNTNMFKAMAGSIPEPLFQNDEVLTLLKRNSMFGDRNRGFVTWQELCQVSPGLDGRTTVNRVRPQDLAYLQQAGTSESWGAATRNAWAATIVSQIVPSIMAPLMLTRITFTLTNMVLGGGWQVQIHSNAADLYGTNQYGGATNDQYVITPKSFMSSNVDISNYLEQFRLRILTELAPALLYSPDWPIHLTVDAQLMRDTVIDISVAGEMKEHFVFPTFADNLLAPVLTNNYGNVQAMSVDLIKIANDVISSPAVGTSSMNMGGSSGNYFGTV